MSDEDLKKPITWQMLKDFVNKIPDEHLQKTAVILFEDESTVRELLEPFTLENDIYIYDDNDEDSGTLKELRDQKKYDEEPFDESLAKLVTPKGTPFLWVE